MIGLTCLPDKVTKFLYPFKRHFSCAQARHHLIFSWVVVMLILEAGKATLARLSYSVPSRIRYWALRRLVASGQWDSSALIEDMAQVTLALLPPPADRVRYVCADKTLNGKRGKQHPLAHKTRMNEHSGYVFGFEMVLLVASWGRYRVPVRMGLVDPKHPVHPNLLFRHLLRDFLPPKWAEQVVVLADAGFAANTTFRWLGRKGYGYVFADRTSAETLRANQLRLWFSSVAYLLLHELRQWALRATAWAKAHCGTIRTKLLKIGAQVRISVRRIWISLASGFPFEGIFQLAYGNLQALPLRC